MGLELLGWAATILNLDRTFRTIPLDESAGDTSSAGGGAPPRGFVKAPAMAYHSECAGRSASGGRLPEHLNGSWQPSYNGLIGGPPVR